MKELTINEMESIAGAYSWDFSSFSSALTSILSNSAEAVASALLLGSAAAALGSTIGSDNGGLFGVGTLGMAIGGLYGLIAGAITGAISGLMYGWDAASAEATKMWDSFSSGSHGIY
ncbi:hypothetical protein ACXDH0_003734 [Klebsiella pneumoniae]